jgi:hypothetical protein
MQQAAATAAAGGAAQTQAAAAAWRAVADIEAAKAKAEGLRNQLLARGDKLTLALAARTAVLAEADRRRTEGATPPLADATADALATSVATAARTTKENLDSKAVPAVQKTDDDLAKLDDTAVGELAAAETDLLGKQKAYEAKQAAADGALAAAEAAPLDLDWALARALVRREAAADLAKAGAAATTSDGAAAAVAYADYQAARKVLNDATPAAATALSNAWTEARDQALSALADLLAAQTLVGQRRFALETKRAEQAAKAATRDADAAAAVLAALAPPPPPPGP